MPSSHLILCRPLLLLPPISPSIRVFSNESTLCMRLNYPPGRLQKIPLVCQSRGQEGVDYLRKYSVSGVWKMNSTPDLGTHWSLVLSNCWVGIFASYCCSVAKSCQTFCNPMDCSSPGSSFHGISQREYWSGLPFLQGIFPAQESNPHLLHW